MSLETDLNTLLSGICANVSPDYVKFGTAAPFVTWHQAGGESVAFMENTLPTIRNARIQINAWATTRIAATALMKQIEDAMIQATAFQARPVGALVAASDPDSELYGAIQDFTVWATR